MANTLEKLCLFIEDLKGEECSCSDLWTTLTLQSTTSMFIRRLEEHRDFQRLVNLIENNPINEARLFTRAAFIWKSPCEPGYAHPMDTFLAVYIYVLSKIESNNDRIWSFIDIIAHNKDKY